MTPTTRARAEDSFNPAAVPLRGELGVLVQEKDWGQTPLGPLAAWPQSLRSVVNIVLTSRYAMWMGWGAELTFLYNDAYRPTLGIKHPWALGASAEKVWAEIWKDIGPRIQTVITTGEATYDEGLLLFLERSGFPEETYHTFSYSPLTDETGRINGMLCVVTEETERVINERRLATLRDLASSLAAVNSEAQVLAAVEKQLSLDRADLPFTLTYLFDSAGRARLACSAGIGRHHAAAPKSIAEGSNYPWPAHEVWAHPVTGPGAGLRDWDGPEPLPKGSWDKPAQQIAIIPIRQQALERPAGFLVAGVNPYRKYDSDYAGFVELIAGQIAAGIASARAYEEERRRAEALAELDRAKTTFFSNISHEFRTPLTLMLGPLDDLLGKNDSELKAESRELLAVIRRSTFRLQRLVNALLDFSRIEAGRAQASYEATDLSRLTGELASTFRSAMERAKLDFRVECDTLPEPVYVDREMWEKVVLNLLSNAFKYTLNGSVSVRLSARDGLAELAIEDTGAGIPASEVPRLFERFHRVEGTVGRTHEGTGIGLALVQELVKLHGGTVGVTSEAGKGSTFTVRLPFGSQHLPYARLGTRPGVSSTALEAGGLVDEALRWLPEGEGSARPPLTEPVPHDKMRSVVLLADDNADMRDYISRLLGAHYHVVAVSNGQEALKVTKTLAPDLVLTDVMMPVLDGLGLLRALRSNPGTRTLPILLLSARVGEESRVEGMSAGADDYLVKPFSARELLARVEAHLSLARMRREADDARRRSEVRLGMVLQNSRMVAWEWDPVGGAVFGLGDHEGIFGGTFETAAEGFHAIHKDDDLSHRARVDEVRRHGGSWLIEFGTKQKNTGETVWLEERATAIADETGRVERIVGVVADVTERKAAEEELRRKNQELTKANLELEEFTYVASHDLQEPLRMVNIYAQLLLRRLGNPDDAEAIQFFEFVQKGIKQMEALIKDLLVYSRVVHPEQEAAMPADLNGALDQALSMLSIGLKETGCEVIREPLPVVWGDERQLSLVFQNLLSNALKYRRQDVPGRILISVETRGESCVVTVRDNGIGFPPQHAVRIFGLFKRLHKDAYPGTGLGLAITKRIVERYGGEIWAFSEGDGAGAEFSFSLRLARQ